MGKIRVGIVGIGNCASSLIQGLGYYSSLNKEDKSKDLGLMHFDLGGYKPEDIDVVSAFDIDKRKVGRPLHEAIFAKPNCTKVFYENFNNSSIKVSMGEVLDGVSEHMLEYPEDNRFVISNDKPSDIEKVLRDTDTEILINYLPVGSEHATAFYTESCLNTGVSLINCIPVFIASTDNWVRRFEERKIPIVGDDIKSQIGATIIHRALTRLFEDRGVKIDRTYQLNFGGNTDFLNMLNHSRLKSKKISKTEAVQSQMGNPLDMENIHIGPSDYIPWQKDNKVCYLRIEGRGFSGIPLNLEIRLSVEDSPNSAGIVIDAIRCCKLARNRSIGGVLTSVSAYFMKHPLIQMPDNDASHMVEEFIQGKRER